MKRLFFVALLCLGGLVVKPQSTDIGIKGGLNVANLKIEDFDDAETIMSFYAGLLAHIHVTDNIAVQPELFFSGQGAKTTISGTEFKTKLGYLNMPVLLQFMFGEGFRVQTGPQVGYLLSAKAKNGGEVDIKDDFKKVDFSWPIGASYVTGSGFGIDARYVFGISNVSEESTQKVMNRVFSVGIFYQFHGSSK